MAEVEEDSIIEKAGEAEVEESIFWLTGSGVCECEDRVTPHGSGALTADDVPANIPDLTKEEPTAGTK